MSFQSNRQTNIWVLTDNRPGNVTQCLGVANALNLPFTIKPIIYSPLSFLPNFMWGSQLLGVTKDSKQTLTPPLPKIVIAAGRKLGAVARYIKKMSGENTIIIQLMNPNLPFADYDFVFLPEHDGPIADKNIYRTFGTPHQMTDDKLQAADKFWRPKLSHLPKPWISILVGGGGRGKKLESKDIKNFIQRLNQETDKSGGSLLITTSRRTPEDVVDMLDDGLTAPKYIYEWGQTTENPYVGLLALADVLIVTGDSMAMCSEACATGKPVYIFNPPSLLRPKHKRFHASLFNHDFARPFTDLDLQDQGWQPKKLQAAHQVAQTVLSELKRRDKDFFNQLKGQSS